MNRFRHSVAVSAIFAVLVATTVSLLPGHAHDSDSARPYDMLSQQPSSLPGCLRSKFNSPRRGRFFEAVAGRLAPLSGRSVGHLFSPRSWCLG